jgi:acyl dehydratase
MASERIYEWDVAREGDESPPFVFEVTRRTIAEYCIAIRLHNPVYVDDEAARAAGLPGIVAPPTMCYTYAPMRRVDLVAARGYVAPEQAREQPRSTPFVSSAITFPGVLVRPGDVISSTTRVLEKSERRGNRFITFVIAGCNQRGERVIEYTYACIWEYAKGRNVRDGGAHTPEPERGHAMGGLQAASVSFEAIQVGDTLPALVKKESQETIDAYRALAIPGERTNWKDLHTDPSFAQQGIFGGTVNMGVATVGYMAQLLETGFPVRAILARGARLSMQARQPFRAGDVVSFTGTVVAKRHDGVQRLVDLELVGTNTIGQTVARAAATVVL